jgi:hypothetical protein
MELLKYLKKNNLFFDEKYEKYKKKIYMFLKI